MPFNTTPQQVCYSFYQVNKLFNQFYMSILSEFDLTYTQYFCLLSLWSNQPQTLHQLGNKLDLSSNTLTPLLKRLEEKGLIERVRPEDDKRQLVIYLTEKGKELESQLNKAIAPHYQEIPSINDNDGKDLIAANKALTQQLQQFLKVYK